MLHNFSKIQLVGCLWFLKISISWKIVAFKVLLIKHNECNSKTKADWKKIFIVFWIMGQCNNFLEIFIFKATSSADQNKLTSYKLNQVRFSRNVFHHTRFQLEKEGWHFYWQQIVRSNTQLIWLFHCFCRHFSCKNQLVAAFELQTQMPGYRAIFCDIVCSKMLNS